MGINKNKKVIGGIMKVVVAGDFVPRKRVSSQIGQGLYESLFSDVKQVTNSCDFSIINLECPITNQNTPLIKCGPHLRTSAHAINALTYMGFGIVTLANNHFLDFGSEGAKDTIEVLNSNRILHVGGGENLQKAKETLYVKNEGCKLAIVNCCEHEFSIATDENPGSNPLNPIQQFRDIQEAKRKANYVIVIVHGGLEGCPYPSPRMQETYRFFVECGADAVVNHHQHCYSGYECYMGKPIIYGLGNFSFDGAFSNVDLGWNIGYMVVLSFAKGNSTHDFELIPYIQGYDTPGVTLISGIEKDNILSHIEELSKIISNPPQLTKAFNRYVDSHSEWYRIAFEPWGKGFRSLRKRGWLPSLVSKTKWLSLADYMMCEAHMDVIRRVLENKVTEIRND